MNCVECRGACCEIPVERDELIRSLRSRDPHSRIWASLRANGGRCVKLNEHGLCSIHETKPLVCAIYPAGGDDCLKVVRTMRTPEQYARIRGPEDPERIHG